MRTDVQEAFFLKESSIMRTEFLLDKQVSFSIGRS